MRTSSVTLAASAALALTACAGGGESESPDEMSWEEFEASTYLEPWEDGVYIINGDEPVADEAALREIYELGRRGEQGIGKTSSALIVNTSGGSDTVWSSTQKLNLTYCISDTFLADKARVVAAMDAATASWEAAANVNFVYVPTLDANCNASQTGVVFDVRPVSGQPYLARAFFPNNGRASRNLIIDRSSFGQLEEHFSLAGIVRHELGHALGFRHEHTRPESGTCFEDNSWRQLTPYDSASVMMYRSCNGALISGMELTERDRQGARALYGAPTDDPDPPPPPPTTTWETSGSVAKNEFKDFPAFRVRPGSQFKVVMNGSGDVDLYVRFGARPTKTNWTCRPYADTSNETCDITVPSNASEAYVGVNGYKAGGYNLTVSYLP